MRILALGVSMFVTYITALLANMLVAHPDAVQPLWLGWAIVLGGFCLGAFYFSEWRNHA